MFKVLKLKYGGNNVGNYKRKNDITCKVCGYQCGNGYLQIHINKQHKMTKEEYLSKYPDGIFYTKEFIENRSKNVSKQMYKRWEDTEYRAKMIKVLNDNAHNYAYREKLIKSVKGVKYGPRSESFKQQHSKRMKNKWKTATYRNNWYKGYMSSDKRFKDNETRLKLSKSTSNLWNTPEYRDKVLNRNGNNHSRHFKYMNRQKDVISLMSLQELRVAYLLDLCDLKYIYGGGNIQCFKYILNNKQHKYIPDFQVNDIFIEVKPTGWQSKDDCWNKLQAVQYQNQILLYVYDDDYIDDYMSKITRNKFLYYVDKCKNNINEINFLDLYKKIGDVRNENFI